MVIESYEISREGEEEVMKVDCNALSYIPSLENNAVFMMSTIDKIAEVPSVSRLVFNQKRNYSYSYNQTQLLVEIANLFNFLIKQKKVLSLEQIGLNERDLGNKHANISYVVFNLLRSDPLGAYVETKRLLREAKIANEESNYSKLLSYILDLLGKTKLISLVKDRLAGYVIGDRTLYSEIFKATITPDFIYTRLMASYPKNAEQVDSYSVKNIDINIFKLPNDINFLYHVTPPEFKISEDEYKLLDLARTVLAEHKPKEEEFIDPEKMRQTFLNIGRDLLQELADNQNISIDFSKLQELNKILVRYTVGFGMLEVLLQDPKVQDISINSPVGQTPIFIVHEEFGDCKTNIIPSVPDVEGFATKFRLTSGRPLDEANPILDTELNIPGARARVAIISNPLNPYGLAYALRRHRDKPWTLPLFIKNKMINSLTAGLLSFLIDGGRCILFAGTRSSGKTSMMTASMFEIMNRYRIITSEDTLEIPNEAFRKLGYNIQSMKMRSALTTGGTEVAADEAIRTSLRMGDSSLIVGEIRSSIRGDEEVVIIENGETKRIPIKDLEGKNLSNIKVPTLNKELKVSLTKLTDFVKHPTRKKLFEVITKTGRKVTVTHDHSVFTAKNFKVFPIDTCKLKKGDKIVIPASMPCGYNDIKFLDLTKVLSDLKLRNYEKYVRKAISIVRWKKANEICAVKDIYRYLGNVQRQHITIKQFKELMRKCNITYSLKDLKIVNGTSKPLPAQFPINEKFCRFLGYYVSEGYILSDKHGVIITNSDGRIVEDIISICKDTFGIIPSVREVKGLGKSKQIRVNCIPLAHLISKLGCGRVSSEKRIPAFIYGLSEKKICAFLKGAYSGDGSFTPSLSTGNAVRYFTTSEKLADDMLYLLLNLDIVARVYKKSKSGLGKRPLYSIEFKQRKFIKKFFEKVGFNRKVSDILIRGASHTKDNSVSFDIKELEAHLNLPRTYRHLRKWERCSKDYLQKLVNEVKCSDEILKFANGDFYLDEVKEINEIGLDNPEHVYDLSVNPTENFIGGFGGIVLHNTEARALWEAMRIGALANVVAGTIHGASPYAVFDRVVNDLGVPRTSFKATDIIFVSNPIKSPDGLHKWRRGLQLAEVRKHWEEDPLREKGFVDLMLYDTKTDELKPTDDLINGESDVIKDIAGNVKEWAGNWDAVWENILLRAKIKQTLVDYAKKLENDEILEAPFVVKSNNMFHRLCDEVTEEFGGLDNKIIFDRWEEWLKKEVK